jgi:hypothetical protein
LKIWDGWTIAGAGGAIALDTDRPPASGPPPARGGFVAAHPATWSSTVAAIMARVTTGTRRHGDARPSRARIEPWPSPRGTVVARPVVAVRLLVDARAILAAFPAVAIHSIRVISMSEAR